jgi:hypothetical protein
VKSKGLVEDMADHSSLANDFWMAIETVTRVVEVMLVGQIPVRSPRRLGQRQPASSGQFPPGLYLNFAPIPVRRVGLHFSPPYVRQLAECSAAIATLVQCYSVVLEVLAAT